MPPALSQIQIVDYRKQDRDAVLSLVRALNTVPPPKPLPDPLPPPPEVPLSYLEGLAEQVETIATLSYEEQSTLMVDLKRSLRDPENTTDARALLERLRKRRDLYATIAEEIDELFGSEKKISSAPPRASEAKPTLPAAPTSTDHKPTGQERIKGARKVALIGIVFGFLVLAIETMLFHRSLDFFIYKMTHISTYFFMLGGAIAGGISGTDRRVTIAALIGMGAGGVFIVPFMFLFNYHFFGWLDLVVLMASPIGALVGTYIKKWKMNAKSLR